MQAGALIREMIPRTDLTERTHFWDTQPTSGRVTHPNLVVSLMPKSYRGAIANTSGCCRTPKWQLDVRDGSEGLRIGERLPFSRKELEDRLGWEYDPDMARIVLD